MFKSHMTWLISCVCKMEIKCSEIRTHTQRKRDTHEIWVMEWCKRMEKQGSRLLFENKKKLTHQITTNTMFLQWNDFHSFPTMICVWVYAYYAPCLSCSLLFVRFCSLSLSLVLGFSQSHLKNVKWVIETNVINKSMTKFEQTNLKRTGRHFRQLAGLNKSSFHLFFVAIVMVVVVVVVGVVTLLLFPNFLYSSFSPFSSLNLCDLNISLCAQQKREQLANARARRWLLNE